MAFSKNNNFHRWKTKPKTLIFAHRELLTDFEFSPFIDVNIIATCSNETDVKLWKLPEDETSITEPLMDPISELTHDGSIVRVWFHPLASNLLFTSQPNKNLSVFDVEDGKSIISIKTGGVVDSISWSYDGVQLLTGCNDKKLRLFDIRSRSPLIVEKQAHTSIKPFCVNYLQTSDSKTNYILTVGFGKMGIGEMVLWDPRNMKESITTQKLDYTPSAIQTFYDRELNILYLAGKGDRNIRIYEILPNKDPYIDYLNEYQSNIAQNALCCIPKRFCDVMKTEVARFLKLTNDNTVEPLSMVVPRKDNIAGYFAEDIFPDCWDGKPTLTGKEWLDGKNVPPKLSTLRPEGKTSIYDISPELGGKKRPRRKSIKKSQPVIINQKVETTTGWRSWLLFFGVGVKYAFMAIPVFIYRKLWTTIKSIQTVSETNSQKEESVHQKKQVVQNKEGYNIIPDGGPKVMASIEKITKEDLLRRDFEKDPTLLAQEIFLIDLKKGKQKLLMMAKGRRHTRVSLVPLHKSSLKSTESFILQSGNVIYQWNGVKANRIQRAKAMDVCNTIKFKERGGDAKIVVIDQEKGCDDPKMEQNFWRLLGGKPEKIEPMEEEDGTWHITVDGQAKLYRVNDTDIYEQKLTQIDLQGSPPSNTLLDTNTCFIYSNLNEVYVWVGRKSPIKTRRWAVAIGKKIANKLVETAKYVTYTKVPQDGEHTFFKEHFVGFPGSLPIQIKNLEQASLNTGPKLVQQKCNVEQLMKNSVPTLEPLIDKGKGKVKMYRINMETHDKVEYPNEFHGITLIINIFNFL